ncbi:MAG: Rnf-Nqr domain containing protein, partial [Actinomycetota bacterium]|nr:Rnf-Nqr domain containing protein [Actinomycetota bacterium]
MSDMLSHFALLLVGGALVNNILLTRFIGLCPFFGVSNAMETSIGMAGAVLFVMTLASSATWVFWNWILVPLGVGDFLYIPAFILVIASLVQFVEMY